MNVKAQPGNNASMPTGGMIQLGCEILIPACAQLVLSRSTAENNNSKSKMDPLSIATGVAGLLSLAKELVKIIIDYTGDVKSATRDARSVLTEVTALSHVLQQLVDFLRKDDTNSKCRFRETSALCSVIAICKNHIETLYRKVKFQGKPEKDLLGRLKWPFEKQECQEIVEVLHRCSQTFTFSLQIANWYFSSMICPSIFPIVHVLIPLC